MKSSRLLAVCVAFTLFLTVSLASAQVYGGGTTGTIPVFTGTVDIGNSAIIQNSKGISVQGWSDTIDGFSIQGYKFGFGSYSNLSAFLGYAGNVSSTGQSNSAVGAYALAVNTSGPNNSALGAFALTHNTTGNSNTAAGEQALFSNTTGWDNSAFGADALAASTTASYNTAVGVAALYFNTTGHNNTAAGYNALYFNKNGDFNVANGTGALYTNSGGVFNTANGASALESNTTGGGNTADGLAALEYNTTGNMNTALGYLAGPDSNSTNLSYATAIGAGAVVSQSNALVLGGTGSAAVKVGIGTATPSNVFTIAQGSGLAVSDGWSTYSSRRWKTNIETLHGALGKVEQLRGVSYDLQSNGKHEIGVIAEEVGEVLPEIVTWEKNGTDAQSVDYTRLTALLIEAVKEEQAQIGEQAKLIEAQQRQIASLSGKVATYVESRQKK